MTIEFNKAPEVQELMPLFAQTSWAKKRTPDKIARMLGRDDLSVCIRLNGALIGYGRMISDGCYRALLDDIIIDEQHRGRGYGRLLVEELIKLAGDIEEIFLNTHDASRAFYAQFGFNGFSGLTMCRKLSDI